MPRTNPTVSIETARLKLTDGWHASVSLQGPDGAIFAPDDWRSSLKTPPTLLDDPERTLKTEGTNSVLLKTLRIGDKDIRAVIKSQKTGSGLKNFFRSIPPPRAVRNFNTAGALLSAGVPTARPLAALQKRKGLHTIWSIYVYQFVHADADLYHFLQDHLPQIDKHESSARRRIASSIAHILAKLHNTGFWHRDAKASNFLIKHDPTDDSPVILVDLDGIKRYRFRRRRNQFRSLVKLASTVLHHPAINRTDYLRTFAVYSKLVGLDKTQRRRIYRDLVRRSVAVRLLAMTNSAMDSEGQTRQK
ncbi:MAG: hypothetical protein J7M40_05000 [Planctomycetes bacterium]|nr:hypothetical protein [Planctomycetota bacterium]